MSQASKRRCQDDCTALRLSVDSLQARGEQFDGVQARLEEAERDNRALQQRDTMHAVTLKSLAEAHEADRLRLHELDRRAELLALDKMFLAKELDVATERAKAADKERERMSSKIDDLRKHKEQLVEQLSAQRRCGQARPARDALHLAPLTHCPSISRYRARACAIYSTRVRDEHKTAYEEKLAVSRGWTHALHNTLCSPYSR